MSSGEESGERNPFAPPSADAPDQPWRPRTPQPPSDEDTDERPLVPPPHPWSPGHQGGGWQLPGRAPQPPQPKFDPNDPIQRRSRYALSAGMASLFCVVTGADELMVYLALLLGAIAVYWAVSALRADPSASPTGTRPQTPAALGGLVTGGTAVLFVLALLGANIAYRDYATCITDAPTLESQQMCDNLAPKFLVNLTDPNAR